jgi:two-component system, OmpR family, alkaline phosphatase synthesis response regulator PhoP
MASPLRQLKVLLVEDEQQNVELIKELLSQQGMQVLTTDRVGAALKMLANQKFDCLLVDIHLAQGSGDQLILEVRKDRRNQNYTTPILVISGGISRELLVGLREQIDGALIKPFRQQELVERIQAVAQLRTA